MRTFLGALQFLTIVPIRAGGVPPGRAALFFPLAGALLGIAGAGIYIGLLPHVPAPLTALAVLVFWMVATGGLHEDGLADIADAFGTSRSRARALGILKDSRIGTFGALALLVSALIRWQALVALAVLPREALAAWLVASQAVPRAAMVALAYTSRPVGTGLGFSFCSTLAWPAAIGAIAQGVAAASLCGPRAGGLLVVGTYLILRALRAFFYARIGGVTGDCIGATNEFVEIFVLLAGGLMR
jgi:adenosylcobinamide-GDP ribazoletransferase